MASRAWRRYRQGDGKKTRILPDFIVGSHARMQANRLTSRDRGFYRSSFPDLRIWDPSPPLTTVQRNNNPERIAIILKDRNIFS